LVNAYEKWAKHYMVELYPGQKYQILTSLEDAFCLNLKDNLPRIRGNHMGMIRLIDDQIRRLAEN